MSTPNLNALQSGEADAWDEAFRWLWPTVFAVAQLKLQPYFPNEVEDVAIEALEELVEKVRVIKSSEEFFPNWPTFENRFAGTENCLAQPSAKHPQPQRGCGQFHFTIAYDVRHNPVGEFALSELGNFVDG